MSLTAFAAQQSRLPTRWWAAILLLCCVVVGCGSDPDTGSVIGLAEDRQAGGAISSVKFAPPKVDSRLLFQLLPSSHTGVDFINPLDTSHPKKYLYHSGFFCGGMAVGDVDRDGAPDLFLVNGPGKNRLYRQSGELWFEDVTMRAGVGGGEAWGAGAAMIDIDGDGDLDIYVCNYESPNQLYVNRGNGRFVESASAFGLNIVDGSIQPAFCDYDLDGDLDLYLLTYRIYHPTGAPSEQVYGVSGGRAFILPKYRKYFEMRRTGGGKHTIKPVGRPDRLLQNDGRGRFSDVTEKSGISGTGYGLSAVWWDYDDDGLPDLYVANDMNDPDRFYRNNGDGTFTNVIEEAVPHTPQFAMGADVADVNNDGRFDYLVADMSGTSHFTQKTTMGAMGRNASVVVGKKSPQFMRNALYLNTGTGRFLETAYLTGLANSDWTWAVRLADLDNDGQIDVFFSNGMSRSFNHSDHAADPASLLKMTEWDAYEKAPPRPEQNLAFRNCGDLRFEGVSKKWGLADVGMSGAAVTADFDRDGDLDLVVANLGEPVSIYRNNSGSGHRMLVRLVGTKSNQFGIGAKVRLRTADGVQIRQVSPMRGFISGDEALAHFGLGEQSKILELTVHWPSGHVQSFENLAADLFYTIVEPDSDPPARKPQRPRPTMFTRSKSLADVEQFEADYDDFKRQPLLPNKLSQLGPGMAWGDVDGDGDDDFYLGGGKGQAGQLLVNQGNGQSGAHVSGKSSTQFVRGDEEPFTTDWLAEDMGTLFFDADADDDLDLYVVSGGVESDPGDESFQDRLYLNDGVGKFAKAPEDALPELRDSGSVAVAADFDRDGDLDLFVGGRSIPGRYPLSPNSRLLRNDGGKFADVTDAVAPGLRTTGLVTGALWSDADGDGWLDLLVTHEWGPVKLWHNADGQLTDATAAAGLAEWVGWWNGIAGRDIDGDGDIDYAVTNFGLNTKYHASPEKPALLYFGDFEGKGKYRLVEAEYEEETLFPVRGKSCSTRAMPYLDGKFKTYHDFALAPLEDIYASKCLQNAHRFAATELRSGVLLNDGAARFRFQPLPRLAQVSPGFGVVLTDVDGDGHADLYLVQNFFTPQRETGRMDGGLSLLLNGGGDGSFVPVWPNESGLVVPGDAKSLAVTDLNGDGWPDFAVGVNNDRMMIFENTGSSANRPFVVRLQDTRGNGEAVGARVTVELVDGRRQTAEVYAGVGYLSQSSRALTFGMGSSHVKQIEVRWPDGSSSTTRPPDNADSAAITHSE